MIFAFASCAQYYKLMLCRHLQLQILLLDLIINYTFANNIGRSVKINTSLQLCFRISCFLSVCYQISTKYLSIFAKCNVILEGYVFAAISTVCNFFFINNLVNDYFIPYHCIVISIHNYTVGK